VRRAAALVAAGTLVVGGCGGDEGYAGLSREEAGARIEAAVESAQEDGTLERELGRALAGTGAGRMGRAGGRPLDSIAPTAARDGGRLTRTTAPGGGREAWSRSYALAGLGAALSLCVYAWDGGHAVAVRGDCAA
jgi:hypothetical protein